MFINSKRSQSIIDFAVAFIAIAGLIVGITRIWIWFNANYAKRQAAFQTSRYLAAGPDRPYSDTNKKPVDIGFIPLDLTEDWVFKGTPSGTVSGTMLSGEVTSGPGSPCDLKCMPECLGQAGCKSLEEDFDRNCVCYKDCALNCYCLEDANNMGNIYADQATQLSSQAKSLRESAATMRETAKQCDDPWEFCSWFGGRKTSLELKDAANEQDYIARNLEISAEKFEQRIVDLKACCGKKEEELQKQCKEDIETETNCDAKCGESSNAVYKQCRADLGSRQGQGFCASLAEKSYQSCFGSCLKKENTPCDERVKGVSSSLQSQVQNLNSTKDSYVAVINEINNTLSSCASSASTDCKSSCEKDVDPKVCQDSCAKDADPTACFNKCYASAKDDCFNNCYEPARNSCCQSNCCNGSSWGRGCDLPDTNCDGSCGSSGCPKCGLSKTIPAINTEIQDITNRISVLQRKILELPSCCSNFTDPLDQNSCIENKVNN